MSNPLEKLYRSRKVYVALPSNGKYYHSGITLSVDGELGVMPMTAADEIKLKTPDTLFNGEALFELFRSCAPDIENPREIPACDVDKLLIAIRIATTGINLDVTATCPKCKKKEEYQIDLTQIMNSAQPIPSDNKLELSEGVTIHLNPLTLSSQIKSQIETFYHYRMQTLLNESDTEDQAKAKMFDEALVQAIAIQVSQVADCIRQVEIDGETVTDSDMIYEWVENMDSATHKQVSDQIQALSDPKMSSAVTVSCINPECGHQYKTNVDLNPVNFF